MTGRRRLLATALGAVGATALSGCVTSVAVVRYGDVPLSRPVSGHTVLVRNHSFIPGVLTVRPGTTVTWVFEDGLRPYDVALPGVHSPTLTSGSWSHDFTTPGVYPYRCDLQSHMAGRIVVRG